MSIQLTTEKAKTHYNFILQGKTGIVNNGKTSFYNNNPKSLDPQYQGCMVKVNNFFHEALGVVAADPIIPIEPEPSPLPDISLTYEAPKDFGLFATDENYVKQNEYGWNCYDNKSLHYKQRIHKP